MTTPNHISFKDKFEIILIILGGIFIRLLLGAGPYSGHPGMDSVISGDLEAQRHWIDLTYHLDAVDWYQDTCNTSEEYSLEYNHLSPPPPKYCNDLLYWGLDYPPLTGFHSMIMGYLVSFGFGPPEIIGENCIATYSSSNKPSILHPIISFMRLSSIISDLLIYFPAAYFLVFRSHELPFPVVSKKLAFSSIILFPALILIDHGHFQYNSVSLGFFLWTIYFIHNKHHIKASITFLFGLYYKQMNLYYAPAIFSYFLHLWFPNDLFHILRIAVVVLFTTAFTFLIWILEGQSSLLGVFGRIFPVSRGLFEDKVASFWCTVDPIIHLSSSPWVLTIPLATVLAFIIPINIFWTSKSQRNSKNQRNFSSRPGSVIDMISLSWLNSLIFFLFSFHVHEKTILVPMLPLILYSLHNGSIFELIWLSFISTYSMAPLLFREGLIFPTISLPFLYGISLLCFYSPDRKSKGQHFKVIAFSLLLLIPYFILFYCLGFISPPKTKPFLFQFLITSWSCFLFILYFGIQIWKRLQFGQLLLQSFESKTDTDGLIDARIESD